MNACDVVICEKRFRIKKGDDSSRVKRKSENCVVQMLVIVIRLKPDSIIRAKCCCKRPHGEFMK